MPVGTKGFEVSQEGNLVTMVYLTLVSDNLDVRRGIAVYFLGTQNIEY